MPDRWIQEVGHDLPAELELWWVDLNAAVPAASEGSAEASTVPPDPVRCRAGANAALLELLSRRLERPVEDSEIVTEPGGKPRLQGNFLTFNLAHAGCEALIGIGVGIELGVDLEVARSVPESEAFAREYLSVPEREAWLALSPAARDRWLLDCWTRKEACLKALGVGLRLAPARISTGAGPGPSRVSVRDGRADNTLIVTSLELPSGSPGAAAVVLDGRA